MFKLKLRDLEEYDNKVSNIKNNIDWMKTKIQGHTFFGFTRSGKITWLEYVNKLSEETFEDLLSFFDTLDYFKTKRK